jgi:hypothetical protein
MYFALLVMTASCLVLLPGAAQAIDYREIDRELVHEPAYQSGTPQYALLLFGPQAELRMWVVLDGETLYVDHNGDGDLTAAGEQFASAADVKDINVASADGETRYVLRGMSRHEDEKLARSSLMIDVEINGPVSWQQYCDVALAPSAREARLTHFDGPLVIGPRTINWKIPAELSLQTGDTPQELYALIGTMSAEHGCWTVVRVHDSEGESVFGDGVCPIAEIEFPSRNPGGATVKRAYPLSGFC